MKNLLIIFFIFQFTFLSAIDYLNLPDDELVEMADEGDSEAMYQLGLLIEDLEYKKNNLRLNYIDRNMFLWFEKAANLGHPKAITRIAKEYLSEYGYYKKKDYASAIKLLTTAAEKEDSEAQLLLSIIFYKGLGGLKNEETSISYLSSSQKDLYRIKPLLYLEKDLIDMIRDLVKSKNKDALFILGDFYYFGKTGYYEQNYKKAYRLYTQAAELGNSSASYMIGMMLYSGIGVLKDISESFIWINKSANAGNKTAMIKSAIMNYFGEGTDVNIDNSFTLFSKTAEMGDSLSQYFLGVMYYKGEGTDKDLSLAKKWIKKSYENGSLSAKKFWDSKELWK